MKKLICRHTSDIRTGFCGHSYCELTGGKTPDPAVEEFKLISESNGKRVWVTDDVLFSYGIWDCDPWVVITGLLHKKRFEYADSSKNYDRLEVDWTIKYPYGGSIISQSETSVELSHLEDYGRISLLSPFYECTKKYDSRRINSLAEIVLAPENSRCVGCTYEPYPFRCTRLNTDFSKGSKLDMASCRWFPENTLNQSTGGPESTDLAGR